ncbi:MAG: hypothetical protein ACO1SV_20440 [Fimbriimonas sp.]
MTTLAVCVLILCPYSNQGDTASSVEFDAQISSYEDIARRLSVGGRTVRCDEAIRGRLAALSIPKRPWEEAVRILSRALDLRLSPDGPTRLTLGENPDVKARDKETWQRYAGRYDSMMRSVIDRANRLGAGDGADSITKRWSFLSATMKESEPGSVDQLAAQLTLNYAILDPKPPTPAGIAAFTEMGGVGALIRGDFVAFRTEGSSGGTNFPKWAQWQIPPDAAGAAILERVTLRPADGGVGFSRRMTWRTTYPSAHRNDGWLIPFFLKPSEADPVAFLTRGPEKEEYERERADTRQALESPDLREPIPLDTPSRAELLLAWGRQHKIGVAMEVSAVRDRAVVADGRKGGLTLAEALAPYDKLPEGARKMAIADFNGNWLESNHVEMLSEAESLAKGAAWTVDRQYGVVVVKNRLSFIDRRYPLPANALATLMRTKQNGAFDLPALLAYADAVKPPENGLVGRATPGFVPRRLAAFYPFGRLINALSAPRRAAILEALALKGETKLALAELTGETIRQLQEDFRANVRGYFDFRQRRNDHASLVFHPDFPQQLRHARLTLRFAPTGPGGEGTLTLVLEPTHQDGEPLLFADAKLERVRLVAQTRGH